MLKRQCVLTLVGSSLCLLGLASVVDEAGSSQERIERVENGLFPAAIENERLGQSRSIQERMEEAGVPGLSLAVIDDGEIAWACGYGHLDRESKRPVTPETLFMAGSISKPVAATGALKLVQEGRLNLDSDVNRLLTSWQVPESKAADGSIVTLRRLLTHTAGLTVHGFPGYNRNATIPTIPQVLDGVDPANTLPVRINLEPGTEFRYSGGGYTVMQLLLSDVANTSFSTLLREKVLEPFAMNSSTFENPLPESLHARAASGYWPTDRAVPGGWHVYPEMAAAGLWTTASDLARWVIGIQQAATGQSSEVLNQSTVDEMLTKHLSDWGLGPILLGQGQDLRFVHGGRDEGFDAVFMAYRDRGQGVVVMINKNDNTDIMGEIVDSVAREYDWPGYPSNSPASPFPTPQSPSGTSGGGTTTGEPTSGANMMGIWTGKSYIMLGVGIGLLMDW